MKIIDSINNSYKHFTKMKKEKINKNQIVVEEIKISKQEYFNVFRRIFALYNLRVIPTYKNGLYLVIATKYNKGYIKELIGLLETGIGDEIKFELRYVKSLDDTERLAQYGLTNIPKGYLVSLYLNNLYLQIECLYEDTLFQAKNEKGDSFNLCDYTMPNELRLYEVENYE